MAWFGGSLSQDPIQTDSMESRKLACDSNGHWRGLSLFIHQTEDWTVFEDLSGGCSWIPSTDWLKFAELDEFFLAGYNSATLSAELIVIERGVVLREFLVVPEEPGENVNNGFLPQEELKPIQGWADVADIVDKDHLAYSDRGWLWIF